MENDYFTVTEMENETKIPHQTIRRYMKIHGHYLVMKKSHRSFLIHEKSIKTLNTIRSLYSEGKTSKQVDDHLINNGFALNLDTENKHEDMSNIVPSTLQELKDDLNILHEKLNDQEKFNQLLLEKIFEQNEKIELQQKQIDERLTKRDELLFKKMSEILNMDILNSSAEKLLEEDHEEENQEKLEKKKWYHFFQRKI